MRAPRFVRFNLVGAGGLAAQLSVLWLLASMLSMPVAPATAIAVAVAVVHNFAWHRLWTWRDRGAHGLDAFIAFAAANGLVSLVGNVAITTGLVHSAHLSPLPANLIAIAVCACLNFWLADRLVFRPTHDASRT
jgi:putative flippase GtrA